MKRAETRAVKAGSVTIGGGAPVVVQSMAATKTQNVEATIDQVKMIHEAGAGLVRVAVDSRKDVECLAQVREAVPEANFVVDLQESYRLVTQVAPHVDKVRYNPGHLYHHEKSKSVQEKVAFIAETAGEHDLRHPRGRELRFGRPGDGREIRGCGRARARGRDGDGRERTRALPDARRHRLHAVRGFDEGQRPAQG